MQEKLRRAEAKIRGEEEDNGDASPKVDPTLERIQCLLREKFLAEIDTVQRRVSERPIEMTHASLSKDVIL